MEKNNRLESRTFKNILLVNSASMMSTIACVMIDAIITGQFLGTDAVAAMGLIQPVVLICNLIAPMFGPGTGIVCTRYMGMAKLDRVNQVFTIAVITLLSVALSVAAALFFLSPTLGTVLGGGTNDPGIVKMIRDYLSGFAIGMPFLTVSMFLSSLMMIDNDRRLGIVAVVITLVTDTAFDLLNVTVFHGGMLGMAVATSLSNVVGVLVLMTHFLKKNRALHFKPAGLRFPDLKEVFLNGVPNAISSGSNAIRGLVFNALLLAIATKMEVSAFSVTNSAFSLVLALTIAFYFSTSTICSLYYGAEDKKSIAQALKMSMKTILIVFAVITVLMIVFAKYVCLFFLKSNNMEEVATAVMFIRFMMVQFFVMSLTYSLSGAYQGCGQSGKSYLIVALRDCVLPIGCVVAMGHLIGVKGVGIGLVVSGVLSLICSFLIPVISNKKLSFKAIDLLALKVDFGVPEENIYEASAKDTASVMKVSEEVMNFCKSRGVDQHRAFHTSLFLEEIMRNIIEYGYGDKKEKFADVRVVCTSDGIVIRIQDAGKAFDPVEWYEKNHPEDPVKNIGIRTVIGLAKDVRYVPAMSLNNLTIEL